MKKFLSLVLAMIMALSLVTISAGAVEYNELTDTDEITYEEAVAVLNKIGIIEGYPDGSYKPQAPLTRQVAAKFIVSLLIGPSAAENLTVAVAPYPDVPASSQFAGYISYCKTAGIISGYSDGTFKPEAGLTGYAFSKMLLGALGYKSDIEGFTGAGYTMNVARIGNAAGLFNRIEFQGGETLNRETAAQLCLNTLKATMVEYSGGFNITSGDATIVGAQTRSYVTSNQEYATHIDNRKAAPSGTAANAGRDLYTVEFGEEHFKDLRMDTEGESHDAFGRPSTDWSWKMVTFGTFPLEPDFVFTSQVIKRDDNPSTAAKIRALGMNGFSLSEEGSDDVDTHFLVNGDDESYELTGIADIADWTDNGTLVECYIDLVDDDFISHVVVIRSQLMEVKKIGSDYVTLQKWDDNGGPDTDGTEDVISPETLDNRYVGFNQSPLDEDVNDVEIDDACYEYLSSLKVGDPVVVIPVLDDDVYVVGDAYTPETVSGELTRVGTYAQTTNISGERTATSLTVGGTKYDTSLWNKDIVGIDATDISVTRKDVTLTLDAYGYALLAEDVGATNDYIVVAGFSSALVNGKVVDIVDGFDMSGNKVELNVGSKSNIESRAQVGDLVRYTNSAPLSSSADWRIQVQGDDNNDDSADAIKNSALIFRVNPTRDILKSHTRVALQENDMFGTPELTLAQLNVTNRMADFADGVKFVYVNFNNTGDAVESVNIVKGAQTVSMSELEDTGYVDGIADSGSTYGAQAYLKSGTVRAVVIKTGGVLSSNVLYIRANLGSEGVINGKRIYEYEAAVVNGSEFNEKTTIYSDANLRNGAFATWSESEFDGVEGTFYTMRELNTVKRSTSAVMAGINEFRSTNGAVARVWNYQVNNTGLNGGGTSLALADPMDPDSVDINLNLSYSAEDDYYGSDRNTVDISTKNWLNLSGVRGLDSAKALQKYLKDNDDGNDSAWIRFVFNDNPSDDQFRDANLVVLEAVGTKAGYDVRDEDLPTFDDAEPENIYVPGDAFSDGTGENIPKPNSDGDDFEVLSNQQTEDGTFTTITTQEDFDTLQVVGLGEDDDVPAIEMLALTQKPDGWSEVTGEMDVVTEDQDTTASYVQFTEGEESHDHSWTRVEDEDMTDEEVRRLIDRAGDTAGNGKYTVGVIDDVVDGEEPDPDDAEYSQINDIEDWYGGKYYVQKINSSTEDPDGYDTFDTWAEAQAAITADEDDNELYGDDPTTYIWGDDWDDYNDDFSAVTDLSELLTAEAGKDYLVVASDDPNEDLRGAIYRDDGATEATEDVWEIFVADDDWAEFVKVHGKVKDWDFVLIKSGV